MEQNKSVNFWKGMNLAGTAIMVNLAFLVCCIPVVTIGPAFCGMYSALRYMVRGDGWFRGFKEGIKKNIVRNILVSTALLAVIVDMAFNFDKALAFFLADGGYIPLIIYSVGLVPPLMVFTALWPLHVFVPYENGTDWLKDALKLLVKAPIQLLIVSALLILPVALLLYIPAIGWMMLIVFVGIYFVLATFVGIMLMKRPLEDRLGDYRESHPQDEEGE